MNACDCIWILKPPRSVTPGPGPGTGSGPGLGSGSTLSPGVQSVTGMKKKGPMSSVISQMITAIFAALRRQNCPKECC